MGKEFLEPEKPSKRTRRTSEGSEQDSQEEVGYRKLRTRSKRVEYCEKEFVETIDEAYIRPKPKVVDPNPNKEKKKRGRKPKHPQPTHQPVTESTAVKPQIPAQEATLSGHEGAEGVSASKEMACQRDEVQKPRPSTDQKSSARTDTKNADNNFNDRYDEPFITSTNVDTGDALLAPQPEGQDLVGQYFAL